jgi:hypothetical protein
MRALANLVVAPRQQVPVDIEGRLDFRMPMACWIAFEEQAADLVPTAVPQSDRSSKRRVEPLSPLVTPEAPLLPGGALAIRPKKNAPLP